MDRIKEFFNIKVDKYIFDYNDIRCLLTIINVILIIQYGLSVAYVGLAIAIFGAIRDFTIEEKRINSLLIHSANILLNCYFISMR